MAMMIPDTPLSNTSDSNDESIQRENRIDKTKVIKMAIVHDIAESIVGDLTPSDLITCGISIQEKHDMERKAMDSFVEMFTDPKERDMLQTMIEIRELWNEYEQEMTPEALLCKDLDKVNSLVNWFNFSSLK